MVFVDNYDVTSGKDRIVNDNYTRRSETVDDGITKYIKASVIQDMLSILEINYFSCHVPIIEFTSQEASAMLCTLYTE